MRIADFCCPLFIPTWYLASDVLSGTVVVAYPPLLCAGVRLKIKVILGAANYCLNDGINLEEYK